MSRVAIIGSCITRDLWPIRGDGLADLLYISRTSLPSLFSAPVRDFRAPETPPEGLGRHQHRAVVWDLKKRALQALVAHRPSHIIFDFIDERFDLLRVGGSLATHSWELEASGYLNDPALAGPRSIARLSDGCEQMWLEGADEMVDFLQATPLRNATLILHEARWAEIQRDASGGLKPIEGVEVMAGRPASIPDHNAMLARYEAAFCEKAPNVFKISAPDHRLADAGHRWGLSPFHYVPAYYEEIWRWLRGLEV